MRYPEAHAAKSGSVPFALRGPKSMRRVLATAVAGAIGLVPTVLVSSPAQAAITGYTFDSVQTSAQEGNPLTFDMTRTAANSAFNTATTFTVTVKQGDTDAKPGDYSIATSTVTFPIDTSADSGGNYGGDKQTITINTVDNQVDSDTKTVVVTVTDQAGNIVGSQDLTGKITDNDDPPAFTLDVSSLSPKEGVGNGKISVTAVLANPTDKTVEIPVSLTAGKATAGQDYTDLSANSKFVWNDPSSLASDPIEITITDDYLWEDAQQDFTIKTGAAAAVTGTQSAVVNIVDNEAQSTVTVGKPQAPVSEGQNLVFPVTVDPPAEKGFSVNYASADGPGSDLTASQKANHGSATAPADYTAVSGTLTFPAITGSATKAQVQDLNTPFTPANALKQNITVKTAQDDVFETTPEDLNVTLSNPGIAKLASTPVATGGINDATSAPGVTFTPADVTEGNAGTKPQTFTVTLDKAAQRKITVDYTTGLVNANTANPDTLARSGSDFIGTQGSVVFNPGETSKTFQVQIVGDTNFERDETFEVGLSSADLSNTNTPWSTTEEVKIVNDDNMPTFSIAPIAQKEGNDPSVVMFPIKLSNPIGKATTWTVTVDNSSTATGAGERPGETDYLLPANYEVVVPAGQSTGYAYFLVNGDTVYERDETLRLSIGPKHTNDPNTTSDTWVTGTAKDTTLTLTNDDAAPSIEVNSIKGNEGEKVQVTGTTTGATQEEVPLTFTFKGASVDGSVAATPNDFIDPGVVFQSIPAKSFSGSTLNIGDPVELLDDDTPEGPKTILISGTSLAGVGKVIDGVLTINASDGGTGEEPGGEEPGEGDLTLDAPASVRGTGPVTITGTATPGATVQLWGISIYDADKDGEYGTLATTKAGANGAFSFSRTINQGMMFKVSSGEMTSDVVTVRAQQKPVLVVSSAARGTVSVAVQGTPRGEGQAVTVQRWTGRAWATAWTAKTGANNQARGTLKLAPGSRQTFRALVGSAPEWGIVAGYSDNKVVTVR